MAVAGIGGPFLSNGCLPMEILWALPAGRGSDQALAGERGYPWARVVKRSPGESTMSRIRCGCWVGFCSVAGRAGCKHEPLADTPAVAADAGRDQNPGRRSSLVEGGEIGCIPAGQVL